MDDRLLAADLDSRAFTLTFARPVAVQDLLLLFVRGTKLSVVPDPAIGGAFIGELKDVTVRQALGLILPPMGLDFTLTGGVIRVFKREPEIRLFDINFSATERTATVTVDAPGRDGSTSTIASITRGDVFADLAKSTQALLSDRGTLSVDRKAGLLQVIDFPERLDRAAAYLEALRDRLHRQVQIDVRVIEVELNGSTESIDWNALSQVVPTGRGTSAAAPRAFTGLRVTDLSRLMAALATQGRVSTIADPRILTLNNEPAIVRAVASRQDEVRLTVTPQIGSDRTVMLSLSPLLSRSATATSATAGGDAILLQSDTLARVADGETIVLTGFPTSDDVPAPTSAKDRRARSVTVTKRRTQLLMLLTPRILDSTAD
jgi:type II secretory pathway component GspD/PulD (secretin)